MIDYQGKEKVLEPLKNIKRSFLFLNLITIPKRYQKLIKSFSIFIFFKTIT